MKGGEGMKQAMQTIQTTPEDYGYESITTTLYDLIEAINCLARFTMIWPNLKR